MPDAVSAGANHRLDELMIGILVAEAHQLGERLAPVGAIVVAAGEIERTDGIVGRTHGEDADAARQPARRQEKRQREEAV